MCGMGHAWQGACMVGGMHSSGACMAGEVCMAGGVHGRRDSHCSGRYAPYWNAFLFKISLQTSLIIIFIFVHR